MSKKNVIKDLFYETESLWEGDRNVKKKAFSFSKGYMSFLAQAKTEVETIQYVVKALEEEGFQDMVEAKNIEKGDKVYFNYEDRALLAFVATKANLGGGFKIVTSHVDTPRLDLKLKPLDESENMVFLKTHYYGGIKKYQWVSRPLALHGRLVKRDGEVVEIKFGEDENDPVLAIADLIAHLSKKKMEKKAKDVIEGEEMRVLSGSIPSQVDLDENAEEEEKEKLEKIKKAKVKYNILEILNDKYGVKEEDFLSADLRVVPADKPRSLGLDGSMVMAYGQDDRICVYTSLMSFLETAEKVEDSSIPVLCLVDREEIGSEGITGAKSHLMRYALGMFAEKLEGTLSEQKLREILFKSKALSSDVDVVINPVFPDVVDRQNTAKLGHGGILVKYTGYGGKYMSSEASAQYMAYVVDLFDRNDVKWQVGMLGKIDMGGGGTIAKFMANLGIKTVDFGPGVLSMHAPLEITSKADVYSTYKAYNAFYKGM
jgi:aspartyl aminopeptidase